MSIHTGNPRALSPEGFLSWADQAVKTLEGHGYRLPEYTSPLCWEEAPEGLLLRLTYDEGSLIRAQLQITWSDQEDRISHEATFQDVLPNAVLVRGVVRELETVAKMFTGTVDGSVQLAKHTFWKHMRPGETALEAARRLLLLEERSLAAACRDLIFVAQQSSFGADTRYEMLWWLKSAGLGVPAFGGPLSPPMVEEVWCAYRDQLRGLTLYEVEGLVASFNDRATSVRLGKFARVLLAWGSDEYEENEYEEQE